MAANYESDSPQDRLAAVRKSIANCLSAQSYSSSGRQKSNAQLTQLRQLEKELIDECNASGDGGQWCSVGMQTPPS